MSTITELRNAIKKLEAEHGRLGKQLDNLRGALAYFEGERAQDSDRPPAKTMRNEMVAILTAEGQPLHYKEIHQRLVARGFQVPGLKPEYNVGAHLSSDSRFESLGKSLGKGMWGLKSWSRSVPQEQAADVEPSQGPSSGTQVDVTQQARLIVEQAAQAARAAQVVVAERQAQIARDAVSDATLGIIKSADRTIRAVSSIPALPHTTR